MKKKCLSCQLVNFAAAEVCLRCGKPLAKIKESGSSFSFFRSKTVRRVAAVAAVTLVALAAFYLSLVLTAKPLALEERRSIEAATRVLAEKKFDDEVFLLRYLTVYRGNDHWLNASTREENAYAATNFPFEIMTVYPDFFTQSRDDTERAAILLHEAQHLKGADEKAAYRYVWRNRKRLGWTREAYGSSQIWRHVRKQTREFAPEMFVCAGVEFEDCTE